MIVIILTVEQKELINQFEIDGNLVEPTKDGNGNYFITQAQAEMIESFFEWVKSLTPSEYVPPIITE